MGVPSILIVHPDRKTQRVVQRILGVTGYRVDIADDLEGAHHALGNLRAISPSSLPWSQWSRVAGLLLSPIQVTTLMSESLAIPSLAVKG